MTKFFSFFNEKNISKYFVDLSSGIKNALFN